MAQAEGPLGSNGEFNWLKGREGKLESLDGPLPCSPLPYTSQRMLGQHDSPTMTHGLPPAVLTFSLPSSPSTEPVPTRALHK